MTALGRKRTLPSALFGLVVGAQVGDDNSKIRYLGYLVLVLQQPSKGIRVEGLGMKQRNRLTLPLNFRLESNPTWPFGSAHDLQGAAVQFAATNDD